jgi:cytochrome c oxidase cbb3-type subunit III
MSNEFSSGFWPIYVAVLSLISIAACALLLWMAGRKKIAARSDNTTGHVWDGDLVEMNNPLPRWWVGLFVLTIVFALIYLVLYPGLIVSDGTLRWTQIGEYSADVKQAEDAERPLYAQFMSKPPEQLVSDMKAMAVGERLYMNNCAQCHGSDARGSKGFPNLTDKDWLWGGAADRIKETITKGRNGVMPPMAVSVGTGEEVRNLAHYVLSLSDSAHNNLYAQFGKAKFTVCAACHGVDGKGNTALGAPNLTDGVWLHGVGEEAIVAMVNSGKNNVMPAWESRLTEAQIHVLTGYVLSLAAKP